MKSNKIKAVYCRMRIGQCTCEDVVINQSVFIIRTVDLYKPSGGASGVARLTDIGKYSYITLQNGKF